MNRLLCTLSRLCPASALVLFPASSGAQADVEPAPRGEDAAHPASAAHGAPAPSDEKEDEKEHERDSTPKEHEKRVSLGVRGFGGILLEEGESGPVFGGGLLMGGVVWRHLEVEGSVMLASKNEPRPFFLVELITKWVVERERRFSPHLNLGPLLSVDFTHPVEASGGIVAGGGATWWMRPSIGWIADLNYRLLVGSEISHAITLGVGMTFKVF